MKNLTSIYWIKDEARYIPEFIEFHLLQGFDYFIFYDNKSTDNLNEVISPYIEDGLVEIRYYPDDLKSSKNFWLMNHCIQEQKGKTKWLHFHALDERLYCPSGENLVEFLKQYDNYGGLSVGWILFNSNNHISRPDGLMIDNFTQSSNDPNCHIKTIIQPDKTITTIGTPHNFIFDKTSAVDENFNIVTSSFNPRHYSLNKILLHHYYTLSREEFDIKQNKGILDHNIENQRRPDSEFMWDNAHNQNLKYETNELLTKFSKSIKDSILKRYINKQELLQFINH
jgi:hypothetical protein